MQNNVLYLQLKQTVINASYTIEQVENVTKAQMESIVGANISDNFYINVKKVLITNFYDEDDEAKLDGLKDQLIGGGRQWLLSNFPDVEFERGIESGKKYMKVWLTGKPEVVDE